LLAANTTGTNVDPVKLQNPDWTTKCGADDVPTAID
jgi:hypothetical protein